MAKVKAGGMKDTVATMVVAAEPAHVDAIAALLEELNTFYGEAEVKSRDVRIRQINEALFGAPPLANAVLVGDAQAQHRYGRQQSSTPGPRATWRAARRVARSRWWVVGLR
ncbi:hypothetical protein [Micromonospora haikouensis]|uniref:hypothetical protein n=1 Tax=Micromonospora haikouensis TaxID=686309 RepID=UPI0033EE525A